MFPLHGLVPIARAVELGVVDGSAKSIHETLHGPPTGSTDTRDGRGGRERTATDVEMGWRA